MFLKNMKIRIFVILAVIVLAFAATNTILANTLNVSIINLIGAKVKSNYAYSFVPEKYKSFLYVRNFQNIKSFVEKSGLLNEFKDNYLLEDFKSRYYQNIDMFFIKLDFNLIELSKNIKEDFLVGTINDNEQFLVTSIDFNTKVIFSIINMLPVDINETSYSKTKYYFIEKNGSVIYYALTDDYVIFSNSETVIKSTIDAAGKNAVKENLSAICQADDIYFRNNIGTVYNKYDLLPDVTDISLKINIKSGKSDITCTPSSDNPVPFVKDKENFDTLKIFPMEMPLCYVNNNYPLKNIIESIYNNAMSDNSEKDISNVDLSVLDSFSDRVMIGYNSLDSENARGLSPEICFVLSLKQTPSSKDLDLISDKMKNVVNAVIGTKNWNITNNPSKNYKLFREKKSEFNMLASGKSIIIVYGNNFADRIISQISASKPSFYDKFFKGLSFATDNLVCYSFVNTKTTTESIEPSLKDFLNSSLSIDNDEYDNSFGQVFQFIKQKKPLSIKLFYDKNKNLYYGNTEFLN